MACRLTLVASHFIILFHTCHYKIDLCSLEMSQAVLFLLGFRYANYFVENNTLHRTLFKAYGIRFLIMVYGEVMDYFFLNEADHTNI